ncbi:AcrR family transcriptional regulator [Paenarthrobacter nicotinovorans]|uniref:TetR/AcrR family transcriptional regulator n=1 Tax=Micrococcaceae TaxID=1268 RepID=UPI0008769241|nr:MULTISPECIES: TetR/AcrR family transcriptional regulator [Micrococcaceae]MDR6438215.1 AcrR family transcriptional regulator [Paenarthrobacter nicotinovorans]SCZ52587.1 transcriptional regulator, TetR family [Arthrobacter sp. UNCCL28]
MAKQAAKTPDGAGSVADDELVRSGRDSDITRRALVRAARRRFATEGYRATTVRHIAADAGVNVALINRYFGSKEGLFEACMSRTVDELDPQTRQSAASVDEVIARLLAHVVQAPNADDPLQLLLLLRSSGDENADAIRRRTLEHFTEQLAAAAGWTPGDPDSQPLLLRAQMAIALMLGLVMLRTATEVQPLASSSAQQLTEPLEQVLRILLDTRIHPTY